MPEQIIGSPNQNMMAVNNSGCVPVAGYSGTTIYPLLVDNVGRLMTTAQVIGSIVIGSVSAHVESIYIQSGANIDLGSAWTTVGSVFVVNDSVPVSGIINTQLYTGSEVWQGTDPWIVLGSVNIDNAVNVGSLATQNIVGSIVISTDPLPVSGIDLAGSFAITTNPVPVSGTNLDDFTLRYSQRIDYEDKMQPVYMGLALPGTATDSAGWQIRKNTFTGTTPELITAVLFGSGNSNFDKVWGDRSGTGEAYS